MGSLRSRVIRLAASLPPGSPLRRALASAVFPSSLDIGDPVWVVVGEQRLAGNVRTVTFTTGKVRFAVQVEDPAGPTTLHNLDSAIVVPRPDGLRVEYGFDNYS